MFTEPTKKEVAKLFCELSKFQMGVNEDLKQLKRSYSFNPKKYYDLLDFDNKGYISLYDIFKFFK